MKRVLQESNYRIRLNNLKLAFLIFTLSFVFVLMSVRKVELTYAAENKPEVELLLSDFIYNVGPQLNLGVFPPKVVSILTEDGEQTFLVFGNTAQEIVDEAGITIDEDDMTKPDKDTFIPENSTIRVIKVDFKYLKKSESIPFVTKEVETDELNTGSLQIKQDGENGEREKTIKVIYEDGKAVKSEIVATNLIKEPIEKILLIGTKPATIQDCNHWNAVIDLIAPKNNNPTKNNWLKYIMLAETNCDSGQNTSGKYLGLYQFLTSTFIANGGTNIWDGRDQIKVVSRMYDICQQGQWGPYRNSSRAVTSFKDKFPSQYKEIEKSCGR